jgi:hypothetical protein
MARAASQAPEPDLQRRLTLDLITWALVESIAIYGLLLGFLGGGFELFLLFGACAFVGLLLFFPKRGDYPERRAF